MKHLIIYAHPNPGSLNAQFKDLLRDHLQSRQQQVVVRDLYALAFNPVLSLEDMKGQHTGQVSADVQAEQAYISGADCLTFIYPIWWTGLPALMKGYIDRVFSYGFAYRYTNGVQEGLLRNKQVVVINTQGKSHQEYAASGMDAALSLTTDTGIFSYCGLELRQHFFFDQADRASGETIGSWKRRMLQAFDQDSLVPFQADKA